MDPVGRQELGSLPAPFVQIQRSHLGEFMRCQPEPDVAARHFLWVVGPIRRRRWIDAERTKQVLVGEFSGRHAGGGLQDRRQQVDGRRAIVPVSPRWTLHRHIQKKPNPIWGGLHLPLCDRQIAVEARLQRQQVAECEIGLVRVVRGL